MKQRLHFQVGKSSGASVSTENSVFTGNSASTENWEDCRDGLRLYNDLVEDYSTRALSYDEDSLNAFSGILEKLREGNLPSGFLWGIPRNGFKISLLWNHVNLLYPVRRRRGFPSWSWAGWEGKISYDKNTYEALQSYLQVFEIKDGRKILV